ncbi:putative gliotoxin efflux pump [Pleomassaria siparia CBS 279.74]|uniref:Putative gliotoxin efflux pump n=1 Tax=Pleomassaria siparia CBS 279.74 TaxID=1314801 RepID=A0A6G1K3C1_9PLEO|nr:putative gliotoxin efflux pump [Pleomassaria siparia CBS 279.74]
MSSSTTPAQDAIPDDDEAVIAETHDNIEEHEYPSVIRLSAIFMALVFGIFLTIISTAVPAITEQFHSLDDVGWYGSAMFFPVAATQSFWGKCYKYFPMKAVFLVSIVIFEIGSLVCAVSGNSNTFIAGRAITGTGAAGTFAGCFIIINFCTRPKYRPAATGILSATFALASVVGPLCVYGQHLMALVTKHSFYINLPFGALAVVIFLVAFKPPRAAQPAPATQREIFLQMDLPGVVLISGTVICFTLVMRANVVGTLVGAAVLDIAFGVDQWWQGERALIMTSFLRNRTLLVGGIFEFFISGAFYVALFYLPIYFQVVKGVSAIASGVRLVPLVLALTITQIVLGGAITVTGIFNPFLIAGPALAAIGGGLLSTLDANSTPGQWIGYQILLGVGVGACLTIPLMLAGVVVQPKDVSTATAIIIFAQSIGGALMLAAAQGIFQNELVRLLRKSVPEANPLAIISLGASQEAKEILPPEVLGAILETFVTALKHTFVLAVPVAGIAFVVSFFQPWFKYHKPAVANGEISSMEDANVSMTGVNVEAKP